MELRQINSLFPDLWADCELKFKYHSYEKTTDAWKIKPVKQPFCRLNFVLEGSAVFYSDTQEITLEPGNVYLIPCSIPNGYYGTDSVTLFDMEFYLTMRDGFDFFSSCKRYLSYRIPVEKIAEMARWYTSGSPADMICLKSAVWESLARFSQMLTPEEQRRIHYSRITEKCIAYVRKNLSAALTVKEVSDALFVSVANLSKKFRQEMGIPVAEYIERLVMLKAQRLLLTTDKSIGAIAASLGFCDQFYFSRRFKKHFTISPNEFRKTKNDE